MSAIYPQTDIGNALRFVCKFLHEVRYCPEDKSWYVWDGIRWRMDDRNHLQELAKTLTTDIKEEAESMQLTEDASDEDRKSHEKAKKATLSWANRTAMVERLSAVARTASSISEVIIMKDTFDTHHHLLNCPNGTVDLYTGELHPHNRDLYLSQLCPVEYDPSATSPMWDNLLRVITKNHPDLLPFLRAFVGYVAQGNKCEELVVLAYGLAETGKGTFWNVISKTLGSDFVRAVSPNSFSRQDRPGSSASGDIARLKGSRLALVSESDKGSKLQENFLKMASGGDSITARNLYGPDIEFGATFQIVYQTNHRPKFDSTDTGNRRRYVELPFDNVVALDPDVEVDTGLKKRLTEDPNVLKAVLAWIVQGCVEWKATGLIRPPCVEAATAELFKDNDVLGSFFDECVLLDKDAKVSVIDLRRAYEGWCDQEAKKPDKDTDFNAMVTDRGFVRKVNRIGIDKKSTKVWPGMKLSDTGIAFIRTAEEEYEHIKQQFAARNR